MSIHLGAQQGDIAERVRPAIRRGRSLWQSTFGGGILLQRSERHVRVHRPLSRRSRFCPRYGNGQPDHEHICDGADSGLRGQKLIRIGTCGAMQKNFRSATSY